MLKGEVMKKQIKNNSLRLIVFDSAKELGEKIDKYLLDENDYPLQLVPYDKHVQIHEPLLYAGSFPDL
jgi:hypothetical protein